MPIHELSGLVCLPRRRSCDWVALYPGLAMASKALAQKVRISPVDCRGRGIAPEVLTVAHQISARALRDAERALGDPAKAVSLLEESAAAVSRVLTEKRSNDWGIRNLRAYLLRAFMRRVNHLKRRDVLFSERLTHQAPYLHTFDPSAKLELELLVDELLTRCDAVTRDMFERRTQGYSWKEIGRAYGISAHAAESRFSQALRRLRKDLRS